VKTKAFVVLINLFLGSLLFSCVYDKFDARLKIVNKTGKVIFAITSQKIEFSTSESIEYFKSVNIKPDTSDNILIPWNWEEYIKTSFNKKLNLCIFELDTLLKYENIDSTLRHPILKYEISLSELKSNNWVVIAEMKKQNAPQ
jgi:hypothetical protein